MKKLTEYPTAGKGISYKEQYSVRKPVDGYLIPAHVAKAHDAQLAAMQGVVDAAREAIKRMEPIIDKLPPGFYNLISFALADYDSALDSAAKGDCDDNNT